MAPSKLTAPPENTAPKRDLAARKTRRRSRTAPPENTALKSTSLPENPVP